MRNLRIRGRACKFAFHYAGLFEMMYQERLDRFEFGPVVVQREI